ARRWVCRPMRNRLQAMRVGGIVYFKMALSTTRRKLVRTPFRARLVTGGSAWAPTTVNSAIPRATNFPLPTATISMRFEHGAIVCDQRDVPVVEFSAREPNYRTRHT